MGILLLIAGSAMLGVLSAFFARGGAIFRLLGIAVVGQGGREVSRFRACARVLIAWTPGVAALVVLPPSTDGWMATVSLEWIAVPLERLAPSLLLLAVFVAGAVFALFNVNRGMQDRIAGTYLVPR